MTIVESTRPITGGVDTHLDVHVAAAVDANGGVLGVESFATTPAGYRELSFVAGRRSARSIGWGWKAPARTAPGWHVICAVEGLVVIEVDRPNRQERRRNGKSDELDAIEAARAALSGRASGIAKSADGDVEAIRALLVARRSGRNVRIKYLNQIRHLGFTAPDELRERLRDVPADQLARTAAALRPTVGSDTVVYATKLAIATLGRRVVALDADGKRLDDVARHVGASPRAESARGLRRRHPHRRDLVGRRRRQPASAEERSRVRASVWRCTAARVVGQDPATSSGSTPAATVKRTMPSGGSCSPA